MPVTPSVAGDRWKLHTDYVSSQAEVQPTDRPPQATLCVAGLLLYKLCDLSWHIELDTNVSEIQSPPFKPNATLGTAHTN